MGTVPCLPSCCQGLLDVHMLPCSTLPVFSSWGRCTQRILSANGNENSDVMVVSLPSLPSFPIPPFLSPPSISRLSSSNLFLSCFPSSFSPCPSPPLSPPLSLLPLSPFFLPLSPSPSLPPPPPLPLPR